MYIHTYNKQTLPEALSQEEQMQAFQKLKQENDSKAREKLIEHNMRLVASRVLKRFPNTIYDIEELFQIGSIGLIKAVDTFNITQKTKFLSYAFVCIDNEILNFLRNQKHDQQMCFLEDEIRTSYTDKGGKKLKLADTLIDTDANVAQDYEKKELYEAIRTCIGTLSERDQEIIKLYFEEEQSQREIAAKFGISQGYICRICNNAVNLIAKELVESRMIETRDCKLLEDEKMPSKSRKKVQSIYELLSDYTKEQIDAILATLNERDKELLTLKYGEDLSDPIQLSSLTKRQQQDFYARLVPKIKRRLQNGGQPKRTGKRTQSIYELLNDYSKEHIDAVLEMLNKKDKEMITLKYGEHLSHPIQLSSLTRKQQQDFYNRIIPKIRRWLQNGGQPKIQKKRVRSIYELLSDYSKEEIDAVLETLNEKDKELLILRYGEDLNHPIQENGLTRKQQNDFYSRLLSKIKYRLKNGCQRKGPGRRIQSIYELLSDYSKEEIDAVLETLNEKDKELLALKYGEDLNHPIQENGLTRKQQQEFHNRVVFKLRRRLQKSNASKPIESQMPKKSEETTKCSLFQTPSFLYMLSTLPVEEQLIVNLRLVGYKGRRFDSASIASFLGVEEETVNGTTKKFLSDYQAQLKKWSSSSLTEEQLEGKMTGFQKKLKEENVFNREK